jgi:hypothetical protein
MLEYVAEDPAVYRSLAVEKGVLDAVRVQDEYVVTKPSRKLGILAGNFDANVTRRRVYFFVLPRQSTGAASKLQHMH